MKEIAFDELRKIQLDILKDIHAFCEKEGIRYSVGYGTLIGAIRHKGFIPWDDDIDITMMRSDYERFRKTYKHPFYAVADTDTIESYPHPFVKVYDNRTCIKEKIEYPSDYGVFVDVFPIDNVPDEQKELKKFYSKKRRLNAIYNLKMVSLDKNRSLIKNLVLAVAHVLLAVVNMRSLVRKMEALSAKYADVQTQNAAEFASSDNLEKWILPTSVYAETIDVEFEDTKVKALKDYHTVLTSNYGDYMQLPPENQRVTHHHFDAWWIE